MRRRERIPLHDHADLDSGGLVAASTLATQLNGTGTAVVTGGATTADAVAITDAADYFTGSTVEAALAELGAGGSGDVSLSTVAASGATETLDVSVARTHDVTLTADCTFTFSGAVTAEAWYFTLVLRQDGTGGWDATWPGSVVWPGGSAPVLDTTASTLEVLTFFTLDGGTTWYGFLSGGAAVAALDDLTDVTITGAADGEVLTYDSGTSQWVNAAPAAPTTHWEPVVFETGGTPDIVYSDSGGVWDIVMHEVPV